eukprot:jgi/Mesvir1/10109/Mv06979-RA.2
MAVVEGRQLEDPPRDASSRKPADGALAPRAPPPADTSLPSDVLVCLHGGMKSRKQLLVAFGHFFSHIESCYSGYGWDAVEIYEKEHSRMGALILPTIFSDMTGLECAQEVRKLEALQGLRRIPIALYATNPSFAVTEPELVAAGADYLLICPFTLADASRCVRACLSLRASYDGPGPYDSNNNNHNGVAIFPSKTGLGPLAGGGQHNNAKFRIGGNYANSGNPHDPYGGLIPDVEPNNGAEYSRGYGSSRMVSHGDGGWGGRQPQPHGPSKGNKGSIQHGHGNHYASHHGNGGHNSGGGGGGGAPVAPAALIVGNVTWSRMLAPELLRPYFETVHFASSAAEALELVTAHVYLVVFMDVNLPDNEGIRCARLMSALFRRHSADNVQGRHMRATTDTAAAHALPLPRAFMVPDGGNSTDPNALPGDLPPWAPPAAGMSFRVRFFGCRKATDASSPTEPRPLPPTEASPESSTQGLTSASGSNRKKHEPSAVGIPTPAGFKDLAPASACGVRLPWRRHTGESKLEPGCAFRRIGSATNMASDCLARMRRGQRRHTHS